MAKPDRVYERRLDRGTEAHLIALSCGTRRTGKRWLLRLLADELVRPEVVETISYETVRHTLKQRARATSE